MRILFLSQLVPYPADAGPKVRSLHVLQYLASAGHDVTLVAFSRDTDSPEAIDYLGTFCSSVYTVPMKRSSLKDLKLAEAPHKTSALLSRLEIRTIDFHNVFEFDPLHH